MNSYLSCMSVCDEYLSEQSAGSGGLTAEELQEAVAVCRAHNLDISAI